MSLMAAQITSLTIVYSTIYSDSDQRKHQSSAPLAFVWGIHRWPVNSPHKWPVTRKMFPFWRRRHDMVPKPSSPHGAMVHKRQDIHIVLDHWVLLPIISTDARQNLAPQAIQELSDWNQISLVCPTDVFWASSKRPTNLFLSHTSTSDRYLWSRWFQGTDPHLSLYACWDLSIRDAHAPSTHHDVMAWKRFPHQLKLCCRHFKNFWWCQWQHFSCY